jgi:hypothetical protein
MRLERIDNDRRLRKVFRKSRYGMAAEERKSRGSAKAVP